MATIQIDKTEFPSLQDCKVGEPLDLTGDVTAIDGDTLTIEVSDVNYGQEEADENAAPESAPESPMATKWPPPRAIVAIGIPGAAKRKGY